MGKRTRFIGFAVVLMVLKEGFGFSLINEAFFIMWPIFLTFLFLGIETILFFDIGYPARLIIGFDKEESRNE